MSDLPAHFYGVEYSFPEDYVPRVDDGEDDEDAFTYYELWKVPTDWDPDVDCPWAEKGIFPRGSLLVRCREEDTAEEIKELLEESSPSERFGETMDDAPYEFMIEEQQFEEDL